MLPALHLTTEVVLGGSSGSHRLPQEAVEVLECVAAKDGDDKVSSTSAAPLVLGSSSSLTYHSLGYRQSGYIDDLAKRWANPPELPLEEASRDDGSPVTAVEREALPQLKAAILKRLGLDALPTGFHAHHFTSFKLLCMLRARGGDVPKAADRAIECIEAVDLALKHAKAYEAAAEGLKDLRDVWFPQGVYGQDKRGAPVMYVRLGKLDAPGFVREVGADFHHDAEWYCYFLQWDSLLRESERRGVWLQGHLIVIDLAGFSLTSSFAAKAVAKATLSRPTYPAGEHPMPEGARKFLICSAPWWVGKLWAIAKLLLPARTTAKMSIFSDSHGAEFRRQLYARVDPAQVPRWLVGGEGAALWPHGEGGEVPRGIGAAARGVPVPPAVGKCETI